MAFVRPRAAIAALVFGGAAIACGGGGPTQPAAATKLVFTVQPSNATAGVGIAPAGASQDASGNTVASATNAVTITLGTNPVGGTLSGTATVNAVNGVARFSGLTIDKAGTGYTLAASSGTLTSATSAAFTIGPAAAATLAFTVQPPSSGTAGAAITPTVAAAIQDSFGNGVPSATVTLALGTNPGGGTLSGSTAVSAANGVASFPSLSIDKAGSGYALVASSGALTSAASATFIITPAAATKLVFTVQPPSLAERGQPIAPAVAVAIQDAFGNTAASSADPVMLSIGTNPGGGTLSGTTTVNASAGITTFADLSIDRSGSGYTLVAVSGTLTSATSAAFGIRFAFAGVSVGGDHTCGVTTSGAPYCWGDNTRGPGQLGDGTTTTRLSPAPVAGGLTFIAVSPGYNHSCGLTTGGAAYCWGYNSNGQLGDGTRTTRLSPVPVSGGLTFAAVSAGAQHTCGVTTGGAAYCWGSNYSGELGASTSETCPPTSGNCSTTPLAVSGGLTFAAVSAGTFHTCGLTTGGGAYCWGGNSAGELGDGTTTTRGRPAPVAGGLTFAAVSAGVGHSCGLTTGGAAYCWGDNTEGGLGDGTTTRRLSPVLVAGGLTFAEVRAGGAVTCGVTTGGGAYCWGENGFGQLGDGTTVSYRVSPVPVSGGLSFAAVSAGTYHTCGVTTGGAGYCWGSNYTGQLGDGTTTYRSSSPVRVAL
jgi:alpha-tubulin suppressor-like RCC1 family protein